MSGISRRPISPLRFPLEAPAANCLAKNFEFKEESLYFSLTNCICEYILLIQYIYSICTLARELRISVITTKRAYEELERDGFIETVAGKGSFVAAKNTDFLREEALRRIEAALQEAVDLARRSGVPVQEVHGMLNLLLEEL